MPALDRPQPVNTAAPKAAFYTPQQSPPAGTYASSTSPQPLLFTPLRLRSLELQNRVLVAPMCTYSAGPAGTNALTPWHFAHLSSFALRGPGMTIVEATAVVPEGRISPEDSGLWNDSQIDGLKKIVEFFHSQGQKIGIQLAHAGRKASTVAPWLGDQRGKSILAGEGIGGWPNNVVAPSALQWDDDHAEPTELTLDGIRNVVEAFKAAAVRSVKAGVDTIQIHSAHGYLLHSFLSGETNRRTDQYGGSFENRTRLLFEVITAIREVIPESMPLMVRVSGTDWLDAAKFPDAWTIEQTVELAKLLEQDGRVDLLDVSSGGNHKDQQIAPHGDYQIALAEQVTKALGEGRRLKVTAVGGVSDGQSSEAILQSGKADGIFVGRAWLRDPALTERFARELGVRLHGISQYHRRGRWVDEKRPEGKL